MFSRRDILKCGILSVINPMRLFKSTSKEELYSEIEDAILNKIRKYNPITKIDTSDNGINWGFWPDPYVYRDGKIAWYGFFRFATPLHIKQQQIDYDKKREFWFDELEDYTVQQYIDNRPEYNCERIAIFFDYPIEEFYKVIKHKSNKPYYNDFERIGKEFASYCRTRLKQKLISENLLDA